MNLDPIVSATMLMVAVILDLHHGYWSAPVRAGVRISKGWLLTALRMAESVAALAFFYQLVGSVSENSVLAIPLSLAAAGAITLAMLKRDRAHGHMMATGLQGAKLELAKVMSARLDSHLASLTEGQNRFLAAQEKTVKEAVAGISVMGREARALLDETKRRSGELEFVTTKLVDVLQRLDEKGEALDLLRNELELQQDADDHQETAGEQAGAKLTAEDGRANRMKGLEAQKELADVIRGWGLAVRVGYSKGVPDFRVMRDDELVAVIACKAFTLSESGTKQRRVGKADIIAELKYARSKEVPLVIAVKNRITGRWWMHWVPAGELAEFDGISTPVILAEDGSEGVNILEESVKGVKEKLLGTA